MSEVGVKNGDTTLGAILLWVSLIALALNIVQLLQGLADLAQWSKWIVENWADAMSAFREFVKRIFSSLGIELSWVTSRIIPTMTVLVAIVVFSFRRRVLPGVPVPDLELPERARGIASVVAFALIFAMLALEQSYIPLSEDVPEEVRAYVAACREKTHWSLDFFCAFDSPQSPVLREFLSLNMINAAIVVTYIALLAVVLWRLQQEVFIAFSLAALFILVGVVSSTINTA